MKIVLIVTNVMFNGVLNAKCLSTALIRVKNSKKLVKIKLILILSKKWEENLVLPVECT